MNYSYKQIWLINFPVMMSLLTEQFINITDAIFLGHFGELELGAAAIGGLYYLALYMLGFGFSTGIQVIVAHRNGEKRYSEIGNLFFHGLFFLSFLSLILFLLMYIYSGVILTKLVSSPLVLASTLDYLEWRSYGLLVAFPALAFRAFFVGITRTKILLISSCTMIGVNVVLNYLLIFGVGSFKGMGIAGAALASSLAEFSSFLVLLLYTMLYMDKRIYRFRFCMDFAVLRRLLTLSVWSMFYSFISVAPWFLFFVVIEQLGAQQLAIANILRSISTFFFVVVYSFATTTGSLVGNLLGAGKKEAVLPFCKRMIRFTYGIGGVLIFPLYLFPHLILHVYTPSQSLVAVATIPLYVMLSVFLISVPAYIYSNAMIGTGKTRLSFIFQLITIGCYLSYLFLLENLKIDSLSIYWTAEYLFVTLILFFSRNYMLKGSWMQKEI